MSVYDEANKLWYPFNQQPISDFKEWTAQSILDELALYGDKVAQVI